MAYFKVIRPNVEVKRSAIRLRIRELWGSNLSSEVSYAKDFRYVSQSIRSYVEAVVLPFKQTSISLITQYSETTLILNTIRS
jgi:hypothetical protein